MGVPKISLDPMNVEEFFLFTDGRPDHEKWELIDGEPVLNASPVRLHQKIVGNILYRLTDIARRNTADWEAIPGIGVRISPTSMPEPDVIVRPNDDLRGRVCDDIAVAFEVLSPSTADRDLRWKRKAYASLASLSDYVVVAQDAAEIVVYSASTGFAERRIEGMAATLDLPLIGVSLRLADIYRDTGLD